MESEAPTISRTLLSPHDIMASGKPYLDESNWEYFLKVQLDEEKDWGLLRAYWKPEATQAYFSLLQRWTAYTTSGTFLVMFLLTYLVFLRTYNKEFSRMVKILSYITGGDYTKRLDSHSYSDELAEIATYFNRVLMDAEEEKNKNCIIDDTLRQVERNCAEYRRALTEKKEEIIQLKKEMTDGLTAFFDMVWNGVLIIDQKYQIHFMNEQASRILRFAKVDQSAIQDERMRKTLKPVVQESRLKLVDDVCQWPGQTGVGHTVVCRMRCAAIPTADGSKMFFVILREEKGYPEKRNASYFSDRLIFDILGTIESQVQQAEHPLTAHDYEVYYQRMQNVTRKIAMIQKIERNQLGECQPIHLQKWIRDRYQNFTEGAPQSVVEPYGAEIDVMIQVPETVLAEFLDSVVSLLFLHMDGQQSGFSPAPEIRTSIDEWGKPVINITVPNLSRELLRRIQLLLEERSLFETEEDKDAFPLDQFEQELNYALYQHTKQILRVTAQCFYTESKNIGTIRLTIRNRMFKSQDISDDLKEAKSPTSESMIHNFLAKMP
jgi:hypothetical protein